MNTASRSNTSIAGSVTSPWTSSGMPIASIRASAGRMCGDVGHAAGAVGGRAGRIQLGRDPHALGMAARQFVGVGSGR